MYFVQYYKKIKLVSINRYFKIRLVNFNMYSIVNFYVLIGIRRLG